MKTFKSFKNLFSKQTNWIQFEQDLDRLVDKICNKFEKTVRNIDEMSDKRHLKIRLKNKFLHRLDQTFENTTRKSDEPLYNAQTKSRLKKMLEKHARNLESRSKKQVLRKLKRAKKESGLPFELRWNSLLDMSSFPTDSIVNDDENHILKFNTVSKKVVDKLAKHSRSEFNNILKSELTTHDKSAEEFYEKFAEAAEKQGHKFV